MVVALEEFSAFAVLQSRIHEVWARLQASSMKDDLRYTPTDCFETFPFPDAFKTHNSLEESGRSYYESRASVLAGYSIGLTKLYNAFQDPESDLSEIPKLREMHDSMDRAVLDAYGWTDIEPRCEFILEFDDEDEEDEMRRQRKKKYRYRWPDEIRDDVLARLLELNRQRALEEGQVVTDEAAARSMRNRRRQASKEIGRKLSRIPRQVCSRWTKRRLRACRRNSNR